MKRLKYIVILIVLAAAGKACSLRQFDYCKKAIGKAAHWEQDFDLSQDRGAEIPLLKRKYKAKGIQISTAIVFSQAFKFCDNGTELVFFYHRPLTFSSSQLVPALRGPPVPLS